MNRDRKKLTALLCLCVAFAVVILISNNGMTLQGLALRPASTVSLQKEPSAEPLQITESTTPRALVLYSPQRSDSAGYEKTSA